MKKINCPNVAKNLFILLIVSLVFAIYFQSNVYALTSDNINFQGKIVRNDTGYEGLNVVPGSPACVVSGAGNDTCDFQVAYYTASTGGTLLLTELFSNVEIGQYDGVFELSLGSGSMTTTSQCRDGTCNTPVEVISEYKDLYLELKFSPDGTNLTETFTRMPLEASPYAILSKYAEGANDAFKLSTSVSSQSQASPVTGMVYYNTTTSQLTVYNGTSWEGIKSSLWTDAGTFTYLTSTTDDLVLGASTVSDSTFFFDMDGSSGSYLEIDDASNTNRLLTILSGGNVGIGTATPGAKLEVAGSNSTITNASGDLTISTGGLNGNILLSPHGTGKVLVSTSLGIKDTGTTPTHYTFFQGGDQAGDITYTLPTSSTNGLLRNTAGVLSWDTSSFATTFLGLTDTPSAYTGSGGYLVRVNAGGTALEFVSANTFTDTNDYVDSVSFNTGDGILTLGRTGVLADLTTDLDGRYLQSFTEADTLQTVTNRGATTTVASSFTGGATVRGLIVDHATATYDRILTSIAAVGTARFDGTITNADLTVARTWTFPDTTGTVVINPMTTAGDIIYGGTSGAPTRLAGSATNGYVLKYNTSTNVPYWAADTDTDTDNYVDTVSFNTGDGILTLGRTGVLADLTTDLDGRYLQSFTEADTLQSVTGRGATTTVASSFTGGATVRGLIVDHATATYDRILTSIAAVGSARFDGTITNADLTAARTWTLPNATGTIALTSDIPSVVTTFLGLTDTPSTYTGSGGYLVRVNAGGTALEFVSANTFTDTNDYVDSVSFNTGDGILTLGRTGVLADLTTDLDGRYLQSFTEADTLQTVTNRGATTTVASSFTGGATVRGLIVDHATATYDRILTSIAAVGTARFDGTITNADLTVARTWTLPDATGTVALTSQLYWTKSGSTLYPTTSGDSVIPNGTANLGSSSARWNSVYGTNGYFTTSMNVGTDAGVNGKLIIGRSGSSSNVTFEGNGTNLSIYNVDIIQVTGSLNVSSVISANTWSATGNRPTIFTSTDSSGASGRYAQAFFGGIAAYNDPYKVKISPSEVNHVNLILKAIASQTGDLLQWVNSSNTTLGVISASGNVGIGVTAPTAYLHLKAGTTAANTAPLKFTTGVNLTTAESGAMEWDGSRLYMTNTTPTRNTLAYLSDLSGFLTQGYQTIQEEGGAGLTQRSILNFVGSGFTATDDGANTRTNITLNSKLNAYADLVSANGVLTNTSGTLSWVDLNRGDELLPTGTEGQMLYSNAGTWTAFGGMYWDDVNSRLGIGSSTPDGKLRVHDSRTAPTIYSTDWGGSYTTSNGNLIFNASDNTYGAGFPNIITIGGNSAVSIPSSSMGFSTWGSTNAVFAQSGPTGGRTAHNIAGYQQMSSQDAGNHSYNLYLYSDGGAVNTNLGGTPSHTNIMSVINKGSGTSLYNVYGIYSSVAGNTSDNAVGYSLFTTASGFGTNYAIYSAAGINYFSGNVGIGTTTPASLLTVGSGDLFQVNTTGDLIKIKNVTYSWPSSNGSGVLTNNGSGTLTWAAASGATAWDDIGDPDASSSIAHGAFLSEFTFNSIATDSAFNLSSTSVLGAASSSSTMLEIARSGANTNTAHTAYGVYSTVTNTNATSGTNIAGYFSASGATTANYGLLVANGNVGIGTTTPSNKFVVNTSAYSTIELQYGGESVVNIFSNDSSNIFIGLASGSVIDPNATGNIALGDNALSANTTGLSNTAIGHYALDSNVAKQGSTALGYQAMMYANSTATAGLSYNTAIGYQALTGSGIASNNTGTGNTAVGHQSMTGNTNGYENTALGVNTLNANTTGYQNVAIGYNALYTNVGARESTAVGYEAMRYANSTVSAIATGNTAVGSGALRGSTTPANNTGTGNTVLGFEAGTVMTSGSNNTLLGYLAGDGITSGGNNIMIGYNTDGTAGTSNQLNIGNSIYGNLSNDSISIGDSTLETGAMFAVGATSQFRVDSNGDLIRIKNVPYTWPSSNTSGILANNGSGTLSWSTIASLGGVTGTGAGSATAGQITWWNGTSTITGENDFYWDATNNRLGIGTSAPTASIDIAGASSTISNASGNITITPASNLIVSQGNVGIGTTTPATNIHLRGATDDIESVTFGGGNLSTDWNQNALLKIDQAEASGNAMAFSVSGTANERKGYIQVGHTGGAYSNILGSLSLNPFGGYVGIGTTTPASLLTVGSGDLFQVRSTGELGIGVAPSTSYSIYTTGRSYGIYAQGSSMGGRFYDTDGTSTTYVAYGSYGLYTAQNGYFGGNVGIGTTSPGTKLQISNQSAFNTSTPGAGLYGLHFSGQTTAGYASGITWNGGESVLNDANAGIYVQGSGTYGTKMYFATTNAYVTGSQTRMMIDQNGNVGIGTASPNNPLSVISPSSSVSAIQFGLTATAGGYLMSSYDHQFNLSGGARYTTGALWEARSTTASMIGSYNGQLMFYNNTGLTVGSTFSPTLRMKIDSTGSVSISNPTSGYALGVGRLSGQPTIKATNDWLIMDSNTAGAALNYFSSQPVYLAYGGGNVGVKRNTASYALDVNGNIRSNNEIISVLGSYAGQFRAISGNYGFFIRNDGSATYFMLTASGDAYGSFSSLRPLYINNASGYVTFGNGHGDISERFNLKGTAIKGMILSSEESSKNVTMAIQNSSPIGVISTAPAVLMGFGGHFEVGHDTKEVYTDEIVPLALVGTVPVIVTTENGAIYGSDSITVSKIPGVGAKVVKSGYTVGTALESTSDWNATSCPMVSSVESIIWPVDNTGENISKPCFKLPDGTYIGKILVVVGTSWYDAKETYNTQNISNPNWYRIAQLNGTDANAKFKIKNNSVGSYQNLLLNIDTVSDKDIVNIVSNFTSGGYDISKARINNVGGIKYLEIYLEEVNNNSIVVNIDGELGDWISTSITEVTDIPSISNEFAFNGVLFGISDMLKVEETGLKVGGDLIASSTNSNIGDTTSRWNDIYAKGAIRLGSGNGQEGAIRFNTESKRLELSNDGTTWVQLGDLTSQMVISPEYPGAILFADGSDNLGKMTSDAIEENATFKNYYEWISNKEVPQDYDILVRITLPNDFVSWKDDAIYLDYMTENSVSVENNSVDLTLIGDSGVDAQSLDHISTLPGAWERMSLQSLDINDCNAPGASCTLRISLTSSMEYFTRVGDITLNYNRSL